MICRLRIESPPELEEVVGDPDPFEAKNLLPDGRELMLGLRSGGNIAGGRLLQKSVLEAPCDQASRSASAAAAPARQGAPEPCNPAMQRADVSFRRSSKEPAVTSDLPAPSSSSCVSISCF